VDTDHGPAALYGPWDVLASLADGLYLTDLDRRILYWNPAAERITGWRSEDVVGRQCLADILCHIDKEGHPLCGEDSCPLHRSMVTGVSAAQETLVFGMTASGDRVPMRVTTAPLCNAAGETVGGVETFRDISGEYRDLRQAQRIQQMALAHPELNDPRIVIADHYAPRDIVGGDFHAVLPMGPDRVAFWIGDVMGHGVSAALYTMQMRCLWSEFAESLNEPARFLAAVNERLIALKGADTSFATVILGVLDIPSGALTLVSAGGPPPLLFRRDGAVEWDERLAGVPLGVLPGSPFESSGVTMRPGDSMLLYTDGATEILGPDRRTLGTEGLRDIARDAGFPARPGRLRAIEMALLDASAVIRLPDDVTLMEVRLLNR
jgi:PAS domain S-box-containing protein